MKETLVNMIKDINSNNDIMEQFFEITKESREYDNYFKYLADKESCRIAVNKFFDDNNIATELMNAHKIIQHARITNSLRSVLIQ